MVDGRAAMAYVGKTPWHGLGQELTEGATMETWATESGMDFKVCRSRVRFGEGDNAKIWDDRHVIFRGDNKAPLAVVSKDYQIVQPAQVLSFFNRLCDKHGFKMETAGTLFNGARYWALARLPMDFNLGADKVNAYALLATSCDGSMSTVGKITSVRVVCNNTLGLSMSKAGAATVRVRHSSKFDETAVAVDLGLLSGEWEQFTVRAQRLAARKLSQFEAVNVLIDAMGDANKPVDEQPNARAMAEILKLFNGAGVGSNLPSADGTAWGLINAATEFYDHHAGRSDNARLASSWFGPNGDKKTAVYDKAMALLND